MFPIIDDQGLELDSIAASSLPKTAPSTASSVTPTDLLAATKPAVPDVGLHLQNRTGWVSGYGSSLEAALTPDQQYRPVPQRDGSLVVDPEIHLPSPGMDVDIAYFFNSNQFNDGAFGYGRTINLNLSLRTTQLVPTTVGATPHILVELARGNGTLVSYLMDSSASTYGVPQTPLLFNSLEKDETNKVWRETTLDGRVSLYPLGKLGQVCPIQSVTDSVGNTHTWHYEAGRITALEDAVGRRVTLSYDSNTDLLKTIKDWAERVTTFTYDLATAPGKSLLTVVTGPTGCTTGYGYNADGRLTSVTDPNGHATTYGYDSLGRVTGRTIVGVGAWHYDYPPGKMVTTGPDGTIVTQSVEEEGTPGDVGDAVGQRVTFTYNARGLETSRVVANGGIYTTQYMVAPYYDNNGIYPTLLIDPLGNKTQIRHDAYGNPTVIIYGDLAVEELNWGVYDSERAQRRLRERKQYRTQMSYDNYPDALDSPHVATTRYTYNSRGQVRSVVEGLNNPTTFNYDSVGNVISVQNGVGNFTTYGYDAAGNVTSVQDGLGHITTNAYDGQSRLLSSMNPLGHIWSFAYDGIGNLVVAMDPLGHSTLTDYNVYDQIKTIQTPLGDTATFRYDADGNQIAVVDPLGKISTTLYDDGGRPYVSVDALGHRTTSTYDNVGNIIRVQDALGNVTTMVYDLASRMTNTIDPLGHVNTYVYDRRDRLVQVLDANGRGSRVVYDGANVISTFVDPEFVESYASYNDANQILDVWEPITGFHWGTWSYDLAGRIKGMSTPETGYFSFGYDAAGNQVAAQQGNSGSIWTTIYDAARRPQVEIEPLGQRTTTIYNAADEPIAILNAFGQLTTSVYDADGMLTSVISPLGHTNNFEYDPLGRLKSSTDANGHSIQVGYDANGQPVTQKNQLGYVTTVTYDALGRQTLVQDANGHLTTMSYDAVGNLLWSQDGLGRFTSYTYDKVGNTITLVNARGLVTTMAYNSSHRLVDINYQTDHSVGFHYDLVGRLDKIFDATGITTYLYGSGAYVSSAIYPFIGQLTYAMDGLGNRGALTNYRYSVGSQVTVYDRDENLRLKATRFAASTNNTTTTFLYDNLSREIGRVFTNGVSMHRGFDADGRIVSLSYKKGIDTLLYHTMTYDNAGNVLSVTELDGSITVYSYDASDQLLSEVRTGSNAYSRAYSYDAVGNRLTLNDGSSVTTLTYDAANQLKSQNQGVTSTTFLYDGAGNRHVESAGGVFTTYLWSQDNRLIGLQLPSGEVQAMEYSGDGGLRKRIMNGTSTLYQFDGENLFQEADGATGQVIREYNTYPGYWGGLLSKFDSTPTLGERFYIPDWGGTTRLLLDVNGGIQDGYIYSGFGEEIPGTGSGSNLFGYNGAWGYLRLDEDLILVRERVYDSKNGVWLSKDPIGFESNDSNFYRYCGGNAINVTDPSGLDPGDFFDPRSYSTVPQELNPLNPKSSVGKTIRSMGRGAVALWHMDPVEASRAYEGGLIDQADRSEFTITRVGTYGFLGVATAATALAAGAGVAERLGVQVIEVRVGTGVPTSSMTTRGFHVIFGRENEFMHAVGRAFGKRPQYIARMGKQELEEFFLTEKEWAKITRIPVRDIAQIYKKGVRSKTCVTAAINAIIRSWVK